MDKFKVIDLSTLLPGPFASHLLSPEMFEVIKYEDKRNPDPMRQMWPTDKGISVQYSEINKDKEIKHVDYRNHQDIDTLKKDISQAHVVIENFKPGRMKKFGLDYDTLKKDNPELIYCSISGFGKEHPMNDLPAHDLNILGISGNLTLNNNFEVPPLPIADLFTSYEAIIGILQALLEKKSCRINVSMLDAIQRASSVITSGIDFTGKEFSPDEWILWGSYSCYRLYETKDGKYMALAAIETAFWGEFCDELNLHHLVNSQFNVSEDIIKEITNVIKSESQEHWEKKKIDCFTPVLTYIESKKRGYVK